MLLDGGERFANSRSKTRRHFTQCDQDLFFARRLRLLVGEDVPRGAVLRPQTKDVLTAERRDRSLQDGGATRPSADALRQVGAMQAGDGFQSPPETPHAGGKPGTTKTRLAITYVVEKGKPLATPA